MESGTVLVTGAAGGRAGMTGRHVSEMLLARGVRVRAFVHRIDERSQQLRELGAEIFEGDFLDFHSVQRAVRGVASIYFAYPVQDGLLDATTIAAVAAREANVARVVNLVMLRSSPDAPTPRMRQNWLSEKIFDWAAVGAVHVRAAVFYENLRDDIESGLSSEGSVRLPFGSEGTVVPLVSAEDVARVAVGLLTQSSQTGSAYPVIGSVLPLHEIVASVGRVFGQDLGYKEMTDEEWRREARVRGLNAHAIEHLSQLWNFFRVGGPRADAVAYQVTDAIERIGGADPKTFESFLREQLEAAGKRSLA